MLEKNTFKIFKLFLLIEKNKNNNEQRTTNKSAIKGPIISAKGMKQINKRCITCSS